MTNVMRVAALVLLTALSGIGPAYALDYPTRAVKWVVPYPPGGTTDVLARIMAQWLSEKMGQQFIVEKKPGAGNNIGVEFVVNSPPDGYTILLVNPANGINATRYRNLNCNFIRDIAPVAGLVRTPNVMEVTNAFPARNVAEFIAYCKANPGKINMASSGSGTSAHLSGELFKSMTGCDMLHVPYKGAGPALADLIGVPKGTPRDVIDKLNAEVNRALADPKLRERMADLGGRPIAGTPEDFGKVIAAETAKWEKVVNSSGAKVE